ncbi:MAG: hypothetical protein P4L83_10485 [Nevskia sp.]|nr:hypothetical protein [Nevskia sp.]
MIDFDEKDVVAARRTADGERFALFLSTDVLPFWGQRFWAAMLDTGGDGFGLPVRYGTVCTAPSGWTIRQLVCIVQARMALEHARMPDAGALAVLEALGRAVRQMPEGEPLGSGIDFEPGWQDSPYRWTLARTGDLCLRLCADPASREDGITPELLLIVIDEALRDWTERAPHIRRLWAVRNAIRDALAGEIHRVRLARVAAESSGEPESAESEELS